MKKNIALAAVLFAALAATGCASKKPKNLPPPVDSGASDAGIRTAPAPTGNAGGANSLGGTGATPTGPGYDLTSKIVYFAYDSSEIDTAGQGVISNYGKYLTKSASAKVRLEGHTDARGSAEYNVALGERRAQTVARELKALGAVDGQLSVISYGKERPAVAGDDEDAFAKNRRVEINQP